MGKPLRRRIDAARRPGDHRAAEEILIELIQDAQRWREITAPGSWAGTPQELACIRAENGLLREEMRTAMQARDAALEQTRASVARGAAQVDAAQKRVDDLEMELQEEARARLAIRKTLTTMIARLRNPRADAGRDGPMLQYRDTSWRCYFCDGHRVGSAEHKRDRHAADCAWVQAGKYDHFGEVP